MAVDISHVIEEDFTIKYLIDATINGTGDSDVHLMTLYAIALKLEVFYYPILQWADNLEKKALG